MPRVVAACVDMGYLRSLSTVSTLVISSRPVPRIVPRSVSVSQSTITHSLTHVYKAPRRSQDLYRQLEFESVSEMLTAAQIIVRIDDHPNSS